MSHTLYNIREPRDTPHKDVYEYGDQRSPNIVNYWGDQRLHKVVRRQQVKRVVFEELLPKYTENKNQHGEQGSLYTVHHQGDQMSHKDAYDYEDLRSPYIVQHQGDKRSHKDVYAYWDQRYMYLTLYMYNIRQTRGHHKLYNIRKQDVT